MEIRVQTLHSRCSTVCVVFARIRDKRRKIISLPKNKQKNTPNKSFFFLEYKIPGILSRNDILQYITEKNDLNLIIYSLRLLCCSIIYTYNTRVNIIIWKTNVKNAAVCVHYIIVYEISSSTPLSLRAQVGSAIYF